MSDPDLVATFNYTRVLAGATGFEYARANAQSLLDRYLEHRASKARRAGKRYGFFVADDR